MNKIHHVSLKLLWPLNFFYIYVQIGPERRNKEKLENESKNVISADLRREHSFIKGLIYYLIFCGLCSLLGIFFLLSVYILKSELGINLLSHSHPVKDYFSFLGLCP